jgi:hypothetical protein
MKGTASVFVREDRLPALDGVYAEIVGFRPAFRKSANGFLFSRDALMVEVRVIKTGAIYYGVWASRCSPLTSLARELIAAHGPGCPKQNRLRDDS